MAKYEVITVFSGVSSIDAALYNPNSGDLRDLIYGYENANKVLTVPTVDIDEASQTITIIREATSEANAIEYRAALEEFMTTHPQFSKFLSTNIVVTE